MRPTGYAGRVVAYENVWNGDKGEIADVRLFAYSTPRRANDSLAAELAERGLEVHLIGDARAPRPQPRRNLFSGPVRPAAKGRVQSAE